MANIVDALPKGGAGTNTDIIANEFDTTSAYAVDDYVVYEKELYKCTTDHSAGAWNASDFIKVVAMDEVPTPLNADDLQDLKSSFTPVGWGNVRIYHRYSTTEQVVGEWLDGKPLYECTIDNQFDGSNTKNIAFDSNAVIRYFDGFVRCESNQWFTINSSFVKAYNNNYTGGANLGRNVITIYGTDNRAINEGYVTALYTKSTD